MPSSSDDLPTLHHHSAVGIPEWQSQHDQRLDHAATSGVEGAEKKRDAPDLRSDFPDFGRNWVQEDADSHIDLARAERNGSDSVDLPGTVARRQEDTDRQVDISHPESNEPEPYVFTPGPALGESGGNPLPPGTNLEPRNTGPIWSSPVTIHAARLKERLFVAPWKADRRQRSKTDRDCLATSTADEREHSSRLHQHEAVTSTPDTRDKQTREGEYDICCCVCYFKRELSYFFCCT
ncbi:hypothetical protein EDC04DRAFT_2801247 [Pisolithus marmoratus]|nr:hypothetical protein EDC04DRAFT_2801247 [Pisolithus marmoratus]